MRKEIRPAFESHLRAMLLQSGAKMHLVESMQMALTTLEALSINMELSFEAIWVSVPTEEYGSTRFGSLPLSSFELKGKLY